MARPRCPTATWMPSSRMTTAPSSPSRPRTCRAIWRTNTTRTPTPARPAPTAGCRIRSAASFRPAPLSAFAEMPLVMDTTHHHRNRNVRPRQGQQQFQRVEYRQRRFLAAAPAENSKSIHFDNSGGFLCESRRPLSGFFVMTLRNVLLFRGAANTKSSCSVSFTLQESFYFFPFQPEHLKLPVSVGLVLVEFLGLDVALEGTVKLQGVPVLLNVGQHAGEWRFSGSQTPVRGPIKCSRQRQSRGPRR